MVRACALLLLRRPAHGYELLQQLAACGLTTDGGGLYRALRSLEVEGLARSEWQPGSGPERRMYRLTRKGRRRAAREAEGLTELNEALGGILAEYDRRATTNRRGGHGPGALTEGR